MSLWPKTLPLWPAFTRLRLRSALNRADSGAQLKWVSIERKRSSIVASCGEAKMNIASLADAHLEATGDFDAFVFDDRVYRSASCHDAVCRLAQAFASSGIAPGDRVVLLLPNILEHVLARWAVLRAGAVGVCVAPTAAA